MSANAPKLDCCAGEVPPTHVRNGWQHFMSMPRATQQQFWDLITPALADADSSEHPTRMAAFARTHNVAESDIDLAFTACAFLLNHASALNIDTQRFEADLKKLSDTIDPDNTSSARVLCSKYDVARDIIRQRILHEVLADHGALLQDVDWRVDQITAADRAADLSATVAMLTFRYRTGDRVDRLTLQMTGEMLTKLRAICDQFLE